MSRRPAVAATQAAATKAEAAADALLAWLQTQPRAIGLHPQLVAGFDGSGRGRYSGIEMMGERSQIRRTS